jgi:phosphopantothenoylcysteine decarboxylase/phosphopantothenate--cysteine ligase
MLVAGPTGLPTPRGVRRIDVRTARDMHQAVMGELGAVGSAAYGRSDVFIAVAAVADWRVANVSASKLKKTADGAPPALEFVQNPDILAEVAARSDAPWCVGFAAESEDLEKNGQEKRLRKRVPLLVANIGHATFGRDDNELLLIDDQGMQLLERAGKDDLARDLVGQIGRRLPARSD